jgi:LmbE family N-acetylglucosaminyl deacetylase
VFAKHARLGDKVYVIIATDGKSGARVTNIPAGDSLGILRRLESTCACEALGINPPIFLGIERLDTKIGVRPYLDGRKQLMGNLKRLISQLRPDVLITFGPDGEYGHSEHIVVGATVIDLLLREGWVDKYPLYFPVDIKDEVTDDDDLSYVDSLYLNLRIDYSDKDEQKSFEAAGCYVTQSTPREIKDLIDQKSKDTSNRKYFRRFAVQKGMHQEF